MGRDGFKYLSSPPWMAVGLIGCNALFRPFTARRVPALPHLLPCFPSPTPSSLSSSFYDLNTHAILLQYTIPFNNSRQDIVDIGLGLGTLTTVARPMQEAMFFIFLILS